MAQDLVRTASKQGAAEFGIAEWLQHTCRPSHHDRLAPALTGSIPISMSHDRHACPFRSPPHPASLTCPVALPRSSSAIPWVLVSHHVGCGDCGQACGAQRLPGRAPAVSAAAGEAAGGGEQGAAAPCSPALASCSPWRVQVSLQLAGHTVTIDRGVRLSFGDRRGVGRALGRDSRIFSSGGALARSAHCIAI